MLTSEGVARLWELVAPQISAVRVSDGTQSADAAVTNVELGDPDQDGDTEITVTAVFQASEANFEWAEQSVVLEDGTVLDAEKKDLGRKTSASTAVATITLDLVATGE